ncbi:MAG: N-acetylmuramoyl-L-alanine amidase [Bacteroidota bacterium]
MKKLNNQTRKITRHREFAFIFFALVAVLLAVAEGSSSSLQERQLRIIVEGDTAHPISVSSYVENGLTYISLDDLSTALGIRTFWNDQTKKLELMMKNYRVKFTADNPFVGITGLTTNEVSVQQLPVSVKFRERKLFVPVAFFLPLFNDVSERRLALFRTPEVAHVEPPRPAGPGSVGASPFDITDLSFEPKLNGYLVRIGATKHFDEFESWQKPDGWLYVTIANAKVDLERVNGAQSTGIFNKILAIQYPTSVQLTFKLAKTIASSEIVSDPSSNDILLSLRFPTAADSLAAEGERQELLSALEGARKRWKLDAIVIDAGHGGGDPGAIGVSRVREKDVTLGIALKLGKLIEKNLKGVKVVYTRKMDTFVELYRRGQIANEAGGKLFISIHGNSMRRKPHTMNGFEIYLLRPGRTEEAVRIAERENAVIKLEKGYEKRYQELTEENFILVTMAQSAHMKYSERFAEILEEEMGNHLLLADDGVKQAGFLVLVGASMPNVLVETGYLSNRKEEKFLKSNAGQEKIAEAIYLAVKKYKSEYEKALDEGKEMGSSQ